MKVLQKLPKHFAKKHHRQCGFTLVETMVSVLIAGVGITGLSAALVNAHIMGNSAHQSNILTIARSSAFSQLRVWFSHNDVSLNAYRFRSVESAEPLTLSGLDSEMQKLVNEYSLSFSNFQSTIDCANSMVTTCEVCFHWYDNVRTGALQTQGADTPGATNRSTCQIQIV